MNDILIIRTPEEDELERKRLEVSRLSEALADAELELASFRGSLLRFEQKYYREVGVKYVELDEIKAKIAEKTAAKKPADQMARRIFEEARKTADSVKQEYESYRAVFEKADPRPEPSDEMKKLYRRIAWKVHPDRAVDEIDRERRNKVMAQVNAAFDAGDIVRLYEILREWEASPDSVNGHDTVAELERANRSIAQIKARSRAIEKEMGLMKESRLNILMMEVQAAEREGRDLIRELANKLDEDIEQAKQKLDAV